MMGIGYFELLIILALLVLFVGVPLIALVIVAYILLRDRQNRRDAAQDEVKSH